MIRTKRICSTCDREISSSNYERHVSSCKPVKKKINIEKSWLQENGNFKCPYCGKEYKLNGISYHIWKNHTEDGKEFRPTKGMEPWNKGLSKENDDRMLLIGKKVSNKLKGKEGRKHTDESKKKLSKIAKKNGLGGHTSKKSIHYMQKDGTSVYLQSNYEVTVAQDLDLNDINWVRPEPLIWVDENNESHRYYPDFYLTDFNVYLDPKNDYLIKKDKRKIELVMKQNNVKVLVLDINNLTWNKIKTLL